MLNRREFLTYTTLTAGSLVVPFLPGAGAGKVFAPNGFLEITAEDVVTVVIGQAEMGQGVFTALSAVLAEELDADWSSIRMRTSEPAAQFGNPFFNGIQITAASTSITVFYQPYRLAGAQARQMLLAAASQQLNVPVSELSTRSGRVIAADGKTLSYGQLVSRAAKLPLPQDIALKAPAAFRLIGTSPPRADVSAKSSGKLVYGIDLQRKDLLVAMVAHAPSFGARVVTFDPGAAQKIPGFFTAVKIPGGVAALADSTWSAKCARDALVIEWDERGGAELSTAKIIADYQALAERPGVAALSALAPEEDPQAVGAVVRAEYIAPYLAHAPMEPLNCLIQRSGASIMVDVGTQFQAQDQEVVARILGIDKASVQLTVANMGGGFGRRANPQSDWIAEAAEILRALPDLERPVKLLWSREDDITGGYYRPLVLTRIAATLNSQGKISAWQQRLVGQSAVANSAISFLIKDGVDLTTIDAVATMKYKIPNLAVDAHKTELPIPVQWLRSVGHSHNVYFVESFVDELAHTAKADPLEFRLAQIEDPRMTAVLSLAADKAGWARPAPRGRARGIAGHEFYGTYVAIIAEIEQVEAQIKVQKLVCAVDCGLVVNPDGARAQAESALIFGLSAALYGEITLDKGRPQQSNFHQYRVLRMDRCPLIETYFVENALPPTGMGESCVPSVAPAVCNALFALTQQRIRALPLASNGVAV